MLKNLGGRPTKMTKETLDKLREAFLFGASDEEACAFAQISHTTLYTYQNEHEEFLEQKQQWKKDPILKAKMTVVKSLNDVKDAQWYLERKVKEDDYWCNQFSIVSDGPHGSGAEVFRGRSSSRLDCF